MKSVWLHRLRFAAAWVAVGCAWSVFAETAQPPVEDEQGDAEEVVEAAEVRKIPGDPNNPYRAIVVRNAFRLREPVPAPPPPTNAPPPPEQPKVDVKLAGLSVIKGVRWAYLMVPDPGRPGQFHYPTLSDDPNQGRGTRDNKTGLEIREIDMKAQSVRLVNGGVEATINFKDNGVKNLPAAGGPPKPGAPGQPGVVLPRPVVTGAAGNVPSPGGAAAPAASEALVFSRNPNRASAGMNPNAPTTPSVPMINGVPTSVLAPSAGSDVVVPTRPVRTGGAGGSASTVQPAQPQVTLEQEYQALIRQRQIADQQGIQLPPIPGVPLPTDPNPH